MAVTSSPPARRPRPRLFWSRVHFALRLLGLTGVLLGCAGLVLAAVNQELNPLKNVQSLEDARLIGADVARTALDSASTHWRTLLLLAGAALALLWLLVEVLVILCFTATRRSAFGVNAVVQGALAAVLLVGINVWSYHHSLRLDFTRDQQFTLPAEVRNDLAQLDPNGKTTIIVYQRHKTFGSLTDKDKPPDDYESAAERKVVEKVKDLAEQFRAIGPRIDVEVLDVQARDYKDRLAKVTENAVREPPSSDESESERAKRLRRQSEQAASLRKAIESAPENSLFFQAKGENREQHVQRLSFNDFYLLDKTASQEDRGGRGNLVLLYQGVQPLANRVLHLQEKRPRIGIAVLDAGFASSSDRFYGLKGLRHALEERGFEVQDVVLKKWSGFAPPTADAATVDENALDRLNERQKALKRLSDNLKLRRTRLDKDIATWRKAVEDPKTRDELTRELADELGDRKVTVEMAQLQVAVGQAALEDLDKALSVSDQRLKDIEAEKKKLNVPALEERQRMTDVKAKMARWLADCDLLIVPRLTLWDLASRLRLTPSLHKLDDAQVEAIEDFLKMGKPVLACFGPSTLVPEDRGRSAGPDDEKPDKLEQLLADLGVKFGKETVLFDDEVEALAESRDGAGLGGGQFEPPPVRFEWRPGEGRPIGAPPPGDKPNSLRESMRLTARALGKNDEGKNLPLDIRIRHPRPIYYNPFRRTDVGQLMRQAVAALAVPNLAGATTALSSLETVSRLMLATDPAFLMADARSWNEDELPERDSPPQFEKPKTPNREAKPREAAKDPLELRRRGPFPIGVAFQTRLPSKWYDSAAEEPATVRVAVIGQGGFFAGKELPPAQEKLFVNTINWLLGRDDRLPNDEHTWSYPRVNDTIPPDSEREYLWLWGVRLGLPVLFAFFGFVVLLFRRLR